MNLSLVFSAKTKPTALVFQRVNADEVRQIANGQSDEDAKLRVFAKVSGRVHRANKAFRR